MPAKCPKCGAEARLEAIREAGGRCPNCKARLKIKFTGVPRPVKRPTSKMPAAANLRNSLESIGPYEVVSEISRGGMGIVYKARDTSLKKTVAIKVLLRGGDASEEERKRFRREAEAAAKLQHSNIVPIHAVGVCEGLHYFVMDFIEGEQLDDLIARGSISPRAALDYTEQLADALAYAHAAGVIHRDIKPANVIIDRYGRPQLMDFGLAKEVNAGDRTQLTQVGTTMGTPTYMPPEQAEGDLEGIDAQSDVYSLGALLYEMLTGAPPFDGPSTMAILMKVLEEEPPRPRSLNPRIHPDIETICLKAMAKEKSERYKSAEEVREDVRRFKAGEAIIASAPGARRLLLRWARRHREMVAATLLAVLGLGGWIGYDTWKKHGDRVSGEVARRKRIERLFLDADGILAAAEPDEDALEEATGLYREVLGMLPDRAAEARARTGMARIEKMRRARRISSLMNMGELFLSQRNYDAAAHVFELVLRDYDPANARARRQLRFARGNGTLAVTSAPPGATVYLGTGKAFPEPPLGAPPGKLGRCLGTTTSTKPVEVPMGLHRVTLVLEGHGRQSVPVVVGRNQDVVLARVPMIPVKDVGGAETAANLVRIPGGKVVLEDGSVDVVKPFYIDRYEYPNRLGAKPLCGVTFEGEEGEWSWSEARQAARDADKKLPTRAQWMLAAEGPKALPFPYGTEYDPKAAAVGMAFKDGPLPSGSRPLDRSAFGIFDMSGNVAEWIRDEDDFSYAGLHDACGGRWTSQEPGQSSCRFVKPHTPMDDLDSVGLRCVFEPETASKPAENTGTPGPPAGAIEFEEVWRDKCPPGMVEIRPRAGTKAFKLVPYAFCIDACEWPNRAGAKPWRGSWHEARALARAAKKRLPTRAEWQVACGGPDLLRYPFGDEYADGRLRLGLRADDPAAPYPAGSAEAESKVAPWGEMIYDLCGNVSEWVFDPYDQDHRLRGVVGGCWWNRPADVGVDRWEGKEPGKKGLDGGVTGFRCVVRLGRPEK